MELAKTCIMEKPPLMPPAVDQTKLASESRRRFGKSGLAASGIILTLASRPALGCSICQSPSGFQSGNLSHHGQATVCQGRPPSYWEGCGPRWPTSCDGKFGKVFACHHGSPYASVTLLEMVGGHGSDSHGICMYLTAAYLNAISGWTPFLTEETIQSIFTEWQAKGYFEPIATVKWYSAEIVNYLSGTQ